MGTTTMRNVVGMVEIVVVTMSTHNTALPVNAWIPMVVATMKQLMHQLNLQLMLVDLHNGLVMIIVMGTTTMRNVVGMVEIVVVTMSTHNTALPVNAWIPMVVATMKQLMHQLNLQLMLVDPHNGLVMIIVMMTTTMRNVVGMVEIVVVPMSTHSTALPVNAWIPMVVATMKQLNLQQLQNPVKMTKLPLGVRTRSKKENVT